MNHVTFETAKRLKAAGFPQPLPKFGQIWYHVSSKRNMAIIRIDGVIMSVGDPANMSDRYPLLNIAPLAESYSFAPAATDILKVTPGHMIYFTGEGFVCYRTHHFGDKNRFPENIYSHENPAEAAAMAWMALNKKQTDFETCQTCHIKPSTEMHTCPYATEINDCNNECNCCDGCRHECMQSI